MQGGRTRLREYQHSRAAYHQQPQEVCCPFHERILLYRLAILHSAESNRSVYTVQPQRPVIMQQPVRASDSYIQGPRTGQFTVSCWRVMNLSRLHLNSMNVQFGSRSLKVVQSSRPDEEDEQLKAFPREVEEGGHKPPDLPVEAQLHFLHSTSMVVIAKSSLLLVSRARWRSYTTEDDKRACCTPGKLILVSYERKEDISVQPAICIECRSM